MAGLGADEQAEIAREVEGVLDRYSGTSDRVELELPYITELHWCHLA